MACARPAPPQDPFFFLVPSGGAPAAPSYKHMSVSRDCAVNVGPINMRGIFYWAERLLGKCLYLKFTCYRYPCWWWRPESVLLCSLSLSLSLSPVPSPVVWRWLSVRSWNLQSGTDPQGGKTCHVTPWWLVTTTWGSCWASPSPPLSLQSPASALCCCSCSSQQTCQWCPGSSETSLTR